MPMYSMSMQNTFCLSSCEERKWTPLVRPARSKQNKTELPDKAHWESVIGQAAVLPRAVSIGYSLPT